MSDTTDPNGAPPGDEGPIPYARFAEARRQHAATKEQLTAVQAELATVKAAAEAATTEAARVRAAGEASARALAQFRAGVAAGLTDPEVVDAAVWSWERTPAEGRPAFGDALAAWKAEPGKAPAVLRPWFLGGGPAAPAASGTPPAASPPAAPPSRDPAPPGGTTPAPAAYTPDAIADIIARGDYAKHREGIARALAGAGRH